MATQKRVLCPQRLRKVPRAFSWIDHRLVRDGHISRCSHEALALYLFLVTVADAEGLSYYSVRTPERRSSANSKNRAMRGERASSTRTSPRSDPRSSRPISRSPLLPGNAPRLTGASTGR